MARLALFVAPQRLTAVDHLRRLESSPLYRQREIQGEQAKQLARVKALLYLSPEYHAQFPANVTPIRRTQ
jgi:hypothetical protein